jgi:hypothetical protein
MAEQNAATAHSSSASMPQHFLEHSLGQLCIRRQLENFFVALYVGAAPSQIFQAPFTS